MINTNQLRKMAQIPEVNKAVTWAQVLELAASVTELANELDANDLLIGQLKAANRELTAEVVRLSGLVEFNANKITKLTRQLELYRQTIGEDMPGWWIAPLLIMLFGLGKAAAKPDPEPESEPDHITREEAFN